MKTRLLFYVLIFFGILNINSQTETHQINWTFGSNGASASKTIEIGDTIEWIWGDSGFHTVTNKAGSTETFNSGNENGSGNIYSYTFTSTGSNDYQCNLHPLSMFGTITVVAEGSLGTEDFTINTFSIFPNPAISYISLKLPLSLKHASIKIFNILGEQVYSDNITKTHIDISTLSKSLYFVKISSKGVIHTKRFIKQ